MTGTLTVRHGRYTLILWPPVRFTFERPDEDGWHMVGWAWTWSRPARGVWPHQPASCPPIIQFVRCGPIDLRRMVKRLWPPEEPARNTQDRSSGHLSVEGVAP